MSRPFRTKAVRDLGPQFTQNKHRMIAVWHSPQQNMAYVLVVEGTLADYRSFVALGRSLT